MSNTYSHHSFIIALRLLWREWRAGKWTVLFFALILAVTSFSAQYFFSQKLQQSLNKQAMISLGGDLVVSSSTPLSTAWLQKAEKLKLNHSQTWSFSTVLVSGQQLQFASVQAISNISAPPIGTIWLDKRLASHLLSKSNNTIQIGVAKFKAVMNLNQDQNILSNLSFAPRAIMNLADVPKTQTILPGSQVEYKLLLSGNNKQIKAYKSWLMPQIKANQKILDIHNQRLLAGDILEKANQYLALAIIICLIISGVALFMGTRYYLKQQQFSAGLLRCLGLKQKDLLKIFSWQLLGIAIISSMIGISLGYSLYLLFLKLLDNLLPIDLLSASNLNLNSFLPALLGIIISVALLVALALPAFIALSKTPAISVWRLEKKLTFNFSIASLLSLIFIMIIYYSLFWLLIADVKFIAILLILLFIIILSLYFIVELFFKLLKYTISSISGIWRQGGLNLLRYQAQSKLQIIGFSIIMTAILLLYSVRTDLFSSWQSNLPIDTPNYFAMNIAPDQVDAVQKSLRDLGLNTSGIYPMVRGRLIALNQKPILEAVPASAQNQNALHRELNLSWMSTLPSDNKIIIGSWWTATSNNQPLISIEKNLADNLGIKLGDSLTFQIGNQQLTGKIENFRTLSWTSFHPNFYVIFPRGVLEKFPTTYITSFYGSPQKTTLLNNFTQQFPNTTLIDASQILQQAKMILDQSSKAMQYAFLLTLLSGIVLLIASLQTTLHTRRQAYRIMRIFGASRYYLSGSLWVEFCLTGLLAGLIGALCAALISWGIAHYWLGISYVFDINLWLWGSVLGIFCLTFPALLFTRKILNIPPLLRK